MFSLSLFLSLSLSLAASLPLSPSCSSLLFPPNPHSLNCLTGANAKHPLSVVLVKNKYGVALDGGPIAIFDEETCVGEAIIDTTRPGDEKVRFIPFS